MESDVRTRLRGARFGVRQDRVCRDRRAGQNPPSHVQHLLPGELRPLLDELEARLRLRPHQPLDRRRRLLALVVDQHDPQQRALAPVHGGLLELRRHHLAEPLEAADFDLGVGVELLLEDLVAVLLVARVEDLSAVRQPIDSFLPRPPAIRPAVEATR